MVGVEEPASVFFSAVGRGLVGATKRKTQQEREMTEVELDQPVMDSVEFLAQRKKRNEGGSEG